MNEKICFLIMAHDRIDQLTRLIQTLQYPHFDLYLHLDKKAGVHHFDPALVTTIADPILVHWGAFTQVEASLKLLRAAIASGNKYRYYVIISATDYPLRSNPDIHQFFMKSESEYMYSFHSDDAFWHNRYRKHHFNHIHPLPRRLITIFSYRLQGRIFPYRKLPLLLKPYWGSSWWSLTHEAITYILDFVDRRPEYHEFFRYTHAADESYYQIILENSPFGARIKPNLHYVDWSLGGSHPKVMDDEDFDKFSRGEWLFARKFEMAHNPALLDRIDKELRAC